MITKILIVDDLKRVRQGLRTILTLEEDLQVVGEAGNGVEAIRLVETLKPDVVLMELVLPKLDGFEATQVIKTRFPDIAVVIFTFDDNPVNRERATKVQSDRFIPKGSDTKILLETIREVVKNIRLN